MSNAGSPAVPAFSYAQAAQGLTLATQNQIKSPASSSATSEPAAKDTKLNLGEPGKLDLNSTQVPAKPTRDAFTSPGTKEDGTFQKQSSDSSELEGRGNLSPPKSSFHVDDHDDATTPPTIPGQQSTDSVPLELKEDISARNSEVSEAWEGQPATPSEKATTATEKRKAKETEGDWEPVSPPPAPLEKELRPAPIPAVNFWDKRRAEQEARAKELASQRASTSAMATISKNQPASTEQPKRKLSERTSAVADKDASGSRRKEPETSRSTDTGTVVPPFRCSALFY